MSVLLIFPPLTNWTRLNLGLASLSAYLASRCIPCRIVDLNVAFAQEFSEDAHFERGLEHAAQRLDELHGCTELSFLNMLEYLKISSSLRRRQAVERAWSTLPAQRQTPRALIAADIGSRLAVAALPNFPEQIADIGYTTAYSEFSSHEILESIPSKSIFTGFFERQLEPLTLGDAPRIVGISVFAPSQVIPAFKCASVVRKLFPGAHITVGGSTVSCHFRKLQNPRVFEAIDSIVIDEGEIPLERLWQELGSPDPRLGSVPGLIWLDGGKVRCNAPASPPSLEDLPPPDFSYAQQEQGEKSGALACVPLRLSRGCAWGRCAFCRTQLPVVHRYQHASPDFLFEQIRHFRDQGNQRFEFVNESPDPALLAELCRKLISEKTDTAWRTPMRFDPRLTLECCMTYRQAGCTLLGLGLESCNEGVLSRMRKGIHPAMIDQVLLNLKWSGLWSEVYMIVGFPGETEDEARDSFAILRDRVQDQQIANYLYSVFSLLPDSMVWNRPEEFGVTGVVPPDGFDLDPPVHNYASPGMSRTRAYQLMLEFSNHDQAIKPAGDINSAIAAQGPATVRGHDYPLAFSSRQLYSHIEEVAVTTTCCSDRIRVGQRTVNPIKTEQVMT